MYGTVDWSIEADKLNLGQKWNVTGDPIYVKGGAAVPSTTSSSTARWYIPYTGDDAWAEIQIATAPDSDGEVGPLIRTGSAANDATSGYYVFRYRASSGRLQLMRKDVGVSAFVLLGSSYTYTLKKNDVLRVEAQGATIRGLLNGSVIVSANDSNLPTGSSNRYGGFYVKDNISMGLKSFSIGDQGVTGPGSGDEIPNSHVIEYEWSRWNGSALEPLEMMGLWDGTEVQKSILEFIGQVTAPPNAGPTGASPVLGFTPLRTVNVTDNTGLYAALADARAGDLINMADGTYMMDGIMAECSADGTEQNPIALQGSRQAIITTGDYQNGHYGLHATGDYWRFLGFRITKAKKGFILDGAKFAYIDGIEVDTIGQEAVHFRSASSDGTVINSVIHNTGLTSPSFGEGLYVGSAVSNWGVTFNNVYYGENNGTGPDRSDRCKILNNHVWNTRAEGLDAKEGTTDCLVQGNLFEGCGWTGENSADSAVDVKGKNWLIKDNVISAFLPDGSTPRDANFPNSLFLDALQTHVVAEGYGQDNIFSGNFAVGAVPGYVVSISPAPGAHGNVVYDNNKGVGAAQGIANIPLTAS
jgi:hypothetical protein